MRGLLDGLWRVIESDARLTRLYFDLSAVSVVERDVRTVMREMKESWQVVTTNLLLAADDGPSSRAAAEAGIVTGHGRHRGARPRVAGARRDAGAGSGARDVRQLG